MLQSERGAGVNFMAHREHHFQNNCPELTCRSDFVKLGFEKLYLFLVEKWSFEPTSRRKLVWK